MAYLSKHKLGTAVSIKSFITEPTATTAKITIKDSNLAVLSGVNLVNMTKIADKVYEYIWQSTKYENGAQEGEYTAIVEITISGNTGISEVKFIMERITQ